MKKPLMLLICLTMTYSLMAQEQEPVQEKVKQKEVGLVFRNLDNFGLTFKTCCFIIFYLSPNPPTGGEQSIKIYNCI